MWCKQLLSNFNIAHVRPPRPPPPSLRFGNLACNHDNNNHNNNNNNHKPSRPRVIAPEHDLFRQLDVLVLESPESVAMNAICGL